MYQRPVLVWVRFTLGGINYYLLIFSFLSSGVEEYGGVEFRHSIRNGQRVENRVS